MRDFMLILREDFSAYEHMSPEELQKLVQSHMNWVQELSEKGHFKAGDGLSNEGKVLKGKNGMVTDGPHIEAKEGVGGYYLIQANDFEEAIEISKACPTLQYDGTVEVRPIMIY
ncbi:YciI family protein [Fulvivirgaceae bacterium BMA10]|uniref:YciI family protein n=1 Tax=Splendidivirga corallicola TaxID=3051826 RepID=A0ABT8KXH1_9BACT|nr:YciI family protein [Fulvivirgaceae bacterium BMA10]